MRTLKVVYLAPLIKRQLRLVQGREMLPFEHFSLEGTMESLNLPIGLRMVRSAETDPDAQLDQPDSQFRDLAWIPW